MVYKKLLINLLIFCLLWFCTTSCSKSDKGTKGTEVSKKEIHLEHGSEKEHGSKKELCSEHGVPENECTRCNPSLIPKFKAKGDWCNEHKLPESQCRVCNPDLADKISLSEESNSLAEIKTEKVKIKALQSKIIATGKVAYNERKLAHITSRVYGRIEEIFAFFQSKVKSGQPLISLYSPEYITVQSEYIQSVERLKRVKLIADKEEETTANSIYESAKQKLVIWGATKEEIVKLEQTFTTQPYLIIRAPFSGTIVESNVIQGSYIQAGDNLYKLADLSKLWIIADIYEKDIARVKIAQTTQISTTAYPDETFKGRVAVMGDILDEKTRTFKVRIEVDNTDGKLKPEMFVKVEITSNNKSAISIPKKAVLTDGEDNIVFVALYGNTYQRREVEFGEDKEGFVEVVSGLKTGENVVTEGNFLLKSELLKSKLGAGCAE